MPSAPGAGLPTQNRAVFCQGATPKAALPSLQVAMDCPTALGNCPLVSEHPTKGWAFLALSSSSGLATGAPSRGWVGGWKGDPIELGLRQPGSQPWPSRFVPGLGQTSLFICKLGTSTPHPFVFVFALAGSENIETLGSLTPEGQGRGAGGLGVDSHSEIGSAAH